MTYSAMNTEPKRARRRRDLIRMKARARRVYPDLPKAEAYANHLAVCSCYLCGNRRRHDAEPTMAERRAAEAARITIECPS